MIKYKYSGNPLMTSPSHRDYNTISHPSQTLNINRRQLPQRYHYSSPSHDNHSIEYKNTKPKELQRIARSFNVRVYQSFERSTNLDQRKKSLIVGKKKESLSDNHPEKGKTVKKTAMKFPESEHLSIDMLRGEGYNTNNNRFHRRSYVKAIVPIQNTKSKRVVPIEFEEQLKQANRTFVKQNLHEWMRHKREDILNKVSQQIKLKSEFQKFLPA